MLLRSALIAVRALASTEAGVAGGFGASAGSLMGLNQAMVAPGRTVRVPHFPCREGSDRFLPLLNENDAAPSSARVDCSLPHGIFPRLGPLDSLSSSR